jgi:hypothetical protein
VKTTLIGIFSAMFIVASCSSSDLDTAVVDTVVVDDSVESVTDVPVNVVEFSVTVGDNAGPDSVLSVAVGTEVRLILVNPDADDEFHLHGYDLGGAMTRAGEAAVYQFVASEAGKFEVESHISGDVLMVLVVE